MEFFENLVIASEPKPTYEDELPIGIIKYADELFANDMADLYYPDLHILPLTPRGEEKRWELYLEDGIGRYGAYEYNFTYKGETYLAILVNND